MPDGFPSGYHRVGKDSGTQANAVRVVRSKRQFEILPWKEAVALASRRPPVQDRYRGAGSVLMAFPPFGGARESRNLLHGAHASDLADAKSEAADSFGCAPQTR